MSWEVQADGSVLGPASARAVEWALAQPQRRTALACIGFVAWTRDMQLDPFWAADAYDACAFEGFGAVTILLDTSSDPEAFRVGAADGWVAIVRLLIGKPMLIHILGITSQLTQLHDKHDAHIVPRRHLLSPQEWLRAFPVHHVTTPEADHESSQLHLRRPAA